MNRPMVALGMLAAAFVLASLTGLFGTRPTPAAASHSYPDCGAQVDWFEPTLPPGSLIRSFSDLGSLGGNLHWAQPTGTVPECAEYERAMLLKDYGMKFEPSVLPQRGYVTITGTREWCEFDGIVTLCNPGPIESDSVSYRYLVDYQPPITSEPGSQPCAGWWPTLGPLQIHQDYTPNTATYVPRGFKIGAAVPDRTDFGPIWYTADNQPRRPPTLLAQLVNWLVPSVQAGGGRVFDTSPIQFVDVDWGDGSPIERLTLAAFNEAMPSHVWPAFGIYTIRYRLVDYCNVSSWYSQRIPVHEWHMAVTVTRGELDRTTETAIGGNDATVYLTTGQSSRTQLTIVDEEGTAYVRGAGGFDDPPGAFRWRLCTMDWSTCDETLGVDSGFLWKEAPNDYDEVAYFIPYWEAIVPQEFHLLADINAISFEGQNIPIMPVKGGANYHVSRPTLAADPVAVAATLAPGASQTQTITVTNTSDQPNNAEALRLTWSARTTDAWLNLTDPSPATLGQRESGSTTLTINGRGLQPGIYTGSVVIATETVQWSAVDPWANSPPASPGYGRLAKAYATPLTIPVTLTIESGGPCQTDCPPPPCLPTDPACQPPSGGYSVKGDVFAEGNISGLSVHPSSVIAAQGTITINGSGYQIPGYRQGRENEWAASLRQTLSNLDDVVRKRGRHWPAATGLAARQLPTSPVAPILMNLNSQSVNPFVDLTNNPLEPEGGAWVVDGDLEIRAPFSFVNTGTIYIRGNLRLTGQGAVRVSNGSLGLAVLGNQGITIGPDITGLNATAFFAPNGQIVFE